MEIMEKIFFNPERAEIRNLVFDLGGVLVDLDAQSCKNAFCKIGAKDIVTLWPNKQLEDIVNKANIGQLDTHSFCQEIRHAANISTRDEDIIWAWNQMLGSIKDAKKEKLIILHKKYRIFLLSNTNDIHWNKCAEDLFPMRNYVAEDYFEKIFLSYEMNLLKPDPSIFEHVILEGDINPLETIFIDDTIENCKIAHQLGFNVLQETSGEDWMEYFK